MLRQTFSPARVFSIGAGSYTGTVTAAEGWGQPTRRFELSPGLPGSVDEILHRVALAYAAAGSGTAPGSEAGGRGVGHDDSAAADLVLVFRSSPSGDDGAMHATTADESYGGEPCIAAAAAAALLGPFLERMVGVSYIKASERESHYVQCSLPRQFDAWIHINTTTAVVPIDGWDNQS